MRAQIQPHFLFNTLHSITTLVRTDPVGAEDLIADLAEILRASFTESSSQETTLRRELELVDCYLRIQQRRFSDRLLLVYRIAPEALDAALPPLVLQSLVENAVIHASRPRIGRHDFDLGASRRRPVAAGGQRRRRGTRRIVSTGRRDLQCPHADAAPLRERSLAADDRGAGLRRCGQHLDSVSRTCGKFPRWRRIR